MDQPECHLCSAPATRTDPFTGEPICDPCYICATHDGPPIAFDLPSIDELIGGKAS